jgi:hypothetical protein
MPGRRLTRFLHLERPRPAAGGDAGRAPPEAGGRFDAVERPKAGPAPRPATGARLERFEPAAAPEPALEVLETGAGERPFTRCMRCGTDHGLHATECTTCGASLDTRAQHAFNERLWAERQAEAAREREQGARLRAAQEAASAEEARARRAYAETLAREAGDLERRRLGQLGLGDRRPLGAVLLGFVPPAWRVRAAALGGAALLALLGGGLLARSPGAVVLGLLLAILLLVPRARVDG